MSQLPAVYQDFISYINPAKIIAVVNLSPRNPAPVSSCGACIPYIGWLLHSLAVLCLHLILYIYLYAVLHHRIFNLNQQLLAL